MSKRDHDIVRRAATQWRQEAGAPTLSSATREAVLGRAFHETTAVRPFPALFVTTRRVVLAGVLPLVLLGVLVVVATVQRPVIDRAPTVVASRVGDGVVFKIDNGKREHTVYRSTVPHRFDPEAGVRVEDGTFADAVDDGARVVFYRID